MENNDENKEEVDNKKLIEDINNLEDDENSKKAQFKKKIKNNKENIVIIIVIIAIIICIAIFLKERYNEKSILGSEDNIEYDENALENLFKDNENDFEIDKNENHVSDYDETKLKADFQAQKSNIIVSNVSTDINKKVIASIQNNNTNSIYDIEVYAVFYNEANQIVGIDTDYISVLKANSSYYWKVENTPENYTRYDTFVTKDTYFYDEEIVDKTEKISCTNSLSENQVTVNIKSTEYIDEFELSIIYYDSQNNILDVENISGYELEENENMEYVSYGIWNETENKEVPFERYEVIVNYAI